MRCRLRRKEAQDGDGVVGIVDILARREAKRLVLPVEQDVMAVRLAVEAVREMYMSEIKRHEKVS